MSLQKGRGTVQARSKADEGRAVLKYIDVEDLVPSEDNFYPMSAIDELAGLIELSGGVKQPGLVVPLGGGKYKLLSGHRRRLASIQLVKQGKEAYRKMPCMVEDNQREPGPEAEELRAIDEEILIITTNGHREKTDWVKVQEATRLRALLEKKRRFEKIPGETRKIIAEQLGTTPAQVGRYDSIEKHLIPAFKTWLEKGEIGISVAYELSMLPEDVQKEKADEYFFADKVDTITLEDVRKWKPVGRKPEKETTAGAERETTGAAEEAQTPPQPPPENAYVRTEPTKLTPVPPDGKIVNFPAPPPPPPAPSGEEAPKQEKEPMHKRMAANILEDLQMYCEEMLGIEAGQADTWMERADALAVAIAVLRK